MDGDDDEFDSLYDDTQLLDPALEESLAQAEATYTASQAVRQVGLSTAAPPSHSSYRLQISSNRRGTFAPPAAKKQRLDPGPSNLSHVVASSRYNREPEADQVIVRDLRDEEFADNDDEQWWATNNALDQVEEEAIRMSQQMPTSQPHVGTQSNDRNAVHAGQGRRRDAPVSRKPPDPQPFSNIDDASSELTQLKEELDRLRNVQRAQEEMVEKLKQEAYLKSGEVAVVRQNLTKLNQENSKLREREVLREQEHRSALERLQKDQERRLQRLETETAFRRVEQDTSRRIWPSSVARLPPVGLRETDRRQESQVRAGLTTPTKQSRLGGRGSGSEGGRRRLEDGPGGREEPSTPTRERVVPGKGFSTGGKSVGKGKAFRGLQNSFADFGPVQEKIRQQQQQQQRQSPDKGVPPQGRLAPADWDNELSLAWGQADQDDVVMADDEHLPPSPAKATSAIHRNQSPEDPEAARARQKEHNYLAAVSEILHRRTTIVSLLLSHASPKAAAPTSYPSNRFNPSGSHPQTHPTNPSSTSSTSTLSRLISADLVSSCPELLLFRYRQAVEKLITNLSRARVMEPEEREDCLRLLSSDGIEVEELDFSSATMHLSHAIAEALMTMAGVLVRVCQTDLLVDVLRLVGCLIGVLGRFWLDLECLKGGGDKEAELEFVGDEEEWESLKTSVSVREILAQCIDDCKPDGGEVGEWTLSKEAREDLLQAVVLVLEAMCQSPEASLTSAHHPLRLLQRPGVLHKLLSPDRSTFIILSVVRMLSLAVGNAPLVHECLAAKAGDAKGSGRHGTGARANARFPVLELLVKHLVDRRFDLPESEWHRLHSGILTFLTQASLKSADTLIVLADSPALLAALIRCLSLDSDFVWLQSRATFMLPPRYPTFRRGDGVQRDPTGGDLVQAVERIVLDTRLLNLLYNYPLPRTHGYEGESGGGERMCPISLATKLDQPETYSMLNGIRQSFIVALSRIAFCAEPDWIAPERRMLGALLGDLRKKVKEDKEEVEEVIEEVEEEVRGLDRVSLLLEAIADVAGDLADLVLSPEEVDAVYDLLVGEEEEEEGEEEGEKMQVDQEETKRDEEEEGASETEEEPEVEMSRKEVGRKSASTSPSKKVGRSQAAVDVIEIDDSD